MEWKWLDRDSPPSSTGQYIVALVTNRVRILFWDGEAWRTEQYMAPFGVEVMAYMPLPAFPAVPADVEKKRKRAGK